MITEAHHQSIPVVNKNGRRYIQCWYQKLKNKKRLVIKSWKKPSKSLTTANTELLLRITSEKLGESKGGPRWSNEDK